MFDSLRILGGFHLKFTDTNVFFCDDGLQGFLFDFTVDDFFFEHFDFRLGVHEFFFLRFVGCEQLLQAVGFGGERLLELFDLDLRRDGSFRHVFTRRSSLHPRRVHSSLSSRRLKAHLNGPAWTNVAFSEGRPWQPPVLEQCSLRPLNDRRREP